MPLSLFKLVQVYRPPPTVHTPSSVNMVIDPQNNSFFRSLQEIRDQAANLRKVTGQALALRGKTTSLSGPPPAIPIPTLNLPLPIDVAEFLNDLDLSESVKAELTSTVQGWVAKIQRLYHQKFESTCRQLLAVPQSSNNPLLMDKIENLRQTFQQTYLNRDLPRIHRRISFFHSQLPRPCIVDKKSPFKNEHRPLLEKYFQFNAYPSVQERWNLAQKTKMTPRQIEVWFQNHRNRSKKDDKLLLRRNAPPLDFESWDSTIEHSALDSESDDELSDTSSFDNLLSHADSESCHFSSSSPPHAFPNKYPPDCSMDPFPTNNGVFTFPSITWLRRPVESGVVSKPLTTSAIDELTQMFACKLNFRENMSKTRRQAKNGHYRSPWYSATTIVPCPAPLPSLLRKTCDAYLPATTLHTRTSSPQQDPLFGVPSVLSSTECSPTKRRKASGFRKRWPISSLSCGPYHCSAPSSSLASSCDSRISSASSISSTSSISSIEPLTPTSSQPSSPVIRNVDNMLEFQDQLFDIGSAYLFNDFLFDNALLPEPDLHGSPPLCDFSALTPTYLIPEVAAHS